MKSHLCVFLLFCYFFDGSCEPTQPQNDSNGHAQWAKQSQKKLDLGYFSTCPTFIGSNGEAFWNTVSQYPGLLIHP